MSRVLKPNQHGKERSRKHVMTRDRDPRHASQSDESYSDYISTTIPTNCQLLVNREHHAHLLSDTNSTYFVPCISHVGRLSGCFGQTKSSKKEV